MLIPRYIDASDSRNACNGQQDIYRRVVRLSNSTWRVHGTGCRARRRPCLLTTAWHPERRLSRTAQPGQDHIPLRTADHLLGPGRRHERRLRKPQPARQARSAPGIRLPHPREPSPPRPHRLHPRHTAPITHRNRQENTSGNRTATRSRLTSKSPFRSTGSPSAIHSQRKNRGRAGICSNGGPDHLLGHVQMFLAGAH
jgi:hypothetical protein